MKIFKAVLLIWLLSFTSCLLFQKKPEIYPTGVMFPVNVHTNLSFEGKVIQNIQKRGEQVYFSTETGHVYSIHVPDLNITWEYQAPGSLTSPLYIFRGRIYTVEEKQILHCLDREGEHIWSQIIPGRIKTNVLETADGIFVGIESGSVYVLDPKDGQLIRKIDLKSVITSNILSYKNRIIFGCKDGYLYVIDPEGKSVFSYPAGAPIGQNLVLDGSRLYFFSEDFSSFCIDLITLKRKWKTSLGEKIRSVPAVYENKLLVLCWNGVFYCLDKRNGNIQWWRNIPSRSLYDLAVVNQKVIVSSMSSVLVCFDIDSGEQQGYYEAESEIRTNPLWMAPYILVGIYKKEKEEGRLVYLKKAVGVTLVTSKYSPLEPNDEVVLDVTTTGFFKPEYEYFVWIESKKEILQEKSEKARYSWYPEKAGNYAIGVTVTDEKEKVEATLKFSVVEEIFLEKEKEKAEFLKMWPIFNKQFLRIPWYLIIFR